MLQMKTAGNAILLAYDRQCILATDPWMGEEDEAFWGSWTLSHRIPADIRQDIFSAQYIWFSHGHPDHLNPHSIHRFAGKKILLPDHFGGRIRDSLRQQGFAVEILPERRWVQLSKHIRVLCICTVIQDAILLVDINGHLFVNMNDARPLGCARLIRSICKQYEHTYLLRLAGASDADMINFFDEDGHPIEPFNGNRPPPSNVLYDLAKKLAIKSIIPFSSFHAYQREDSLWAQQYTIPLDAWTQGKISTRGDVRYIPPFANVDCASEFKGGGGGIMPCENTVEIKNPEAFGDCWSDELDACDLRQIEDYFRRKENVADFLSFVNFRVGGKDHYIDLNGTRNKGITFEVPRGSLMSAVQYKIFDDLFIGNFMKTTLHNMRSLYEQDFNFYLTKYADNGGAESADEVRAYLLAYQKRAGLEALYEKFIDPVVDVAERFLPQSDRSILRAVRRRIFCLNPAESPSKDPRIGKSR